MRDRITDPHREDVADAVNRHRIVDALRFQKYEALHGTEREREDQLDHVVAEGQAGRAERPPDMCDRKKQRDDQHIDGVGDFRATAHNICEKSDRQGTEQDLLGWAAEKKLKRQRARDIARGERITVGRDQVGGVPDDVGNDHISEEHGAHDADEFQPEPDLSRPKTEIDPKELGEKQNQNKRNQRLNDMMDAVCHKRPVRIDRPVIQRIRAERADLARNLLESKDPENR